MKSIINDGVSLAKELANNKQKLCIGKHRQKMLEDEIRTMDDLVNAIKNHRCKPVFHQDFSYFLWDIDKLQWSIEDMQI